MPLMVNVTFGPGNTNSVQCHAISILDDDIVETTESLIVEAKNPVGLTVLSPGRVTITIQPSTSNLDSERFYLTIKHKVLVDEDF